MIMRKTSGFVFIVSLALLHVLPVVADAQLSRERVETDEPVYNVFWAPENIGISTVRNISKNNLNTTIKHTFGQVSRGVEQFFGLDDGANTRIGLDYGIHDRFSVGIGRMTFNKIVDLRGKVNILRQTTTGSTPFDLAVKFSTGINTTSGIGLDFSERLSYFTSVMAARKFKRLSMQITPMMAHFNSVNDGNPHQLFGLGVLVNYEFHDRFALSAEYLPVLGDRNAGTHDTFAVALNIDTGGHVFQIFFTTSQWHNEAYIMASNRDRFFDGDFRFGFNIHRVFGMR